MILPRRSHIPRIRGARVDHRAGISRTLPRGVGVAVSMRQGQHASPRSSELDPDRGVARASLCLQTARA